MIAMLQSTFDQNVGFSNGCVQLGPKNPPPLVPSCLIVTNAATGPRAIVCVAPSTVVATAAPFERHGHAAQDQQRGPNQRHRQQDQPGCTPQVLEEIPEVCAAGQSAAHRCDGGNAGRGADELQPHQCEELRKVTQRHFTRVVLQVRVAGEAGRRVERQAWFQRLFSVRIERERTAGSSGPTYTNTNITTLNASIERQYCFQSCPLAARCPEDSGA